MVYISINYVNKVDERTCSVATMAQRHVPWPNATTASQSLAVVGAAIVTPTTATQGPPTVVMPSRTLSSPPFTSSGGATGGWGGDSDSLHAFFLKREVWGSSWTRDDNTCRQAAAIDNTIHWDCSEQTSGGRHGGATPTTGLWDNSSYVRRAYIGYLH